MFAALIEEFLRAEKVWYDRMHSAVKQHHEHFVQCRPEYSYLSSFLVIDSCEEFKKKIDTIFNGILKRAQPNYIP